MNEHGDGDGGPGTDESKNEVTFLTLSVSLLKRYKRVNEKQVRKGEPSEFSHNETLINGPSSAHSAHLSNPNP